MVIAADRKEPRFEDVRLSRLLRALDDGNEAERARAEQILRRVGTNSVPALLRFLRQKDSDFRRDCAAVLEDLGVACPTAQKQRHRAVAGFYALGDRGLVAVPSIIALFNDGELDSDASAALVAIGTNTIPYLAQALRHPRPHFRWNAARSVAAFGGLASLAVPPLALNMHDANATVRYWSVVALAQIAEQPEVSVPALILGLSDRKPSVRDVSARGLARFGRNAEAALPALHDALNRHGRGFYIYAADAINRISEKSQRKSED